MGRQTVYIAGPMRGKPYYNARAFDQAALAFSENGFDVFNPVDLDRAAGFEPLDCPPDTDWNELPAGLVLTDIVARDLEALLRSDRIALLPGWANSKGARAEKAVADWLGLPYMLITGYQI